MMGFSLGHLIILLVIVLLFGGKRLPELGGALGKGLRSFKKGLEGKLDGEEEPPRVEGPKQPAHSDSDPHSKDSESKS